MNAQFYKDVKNNVVIPQLKKFGVPMVLIEPQTTYDAATGGTAEVTTEFLGSGVRRKQVSKRLEASLVEQGDAVVMVAGVPQPKIGDRLKFNGHEYSIVDSVAVGPGGVDLYYEVVVKA